MQLELMPFKKSIVALETSLDVYDSPLTLDDSVMAKQLREKAIQAFEVSYDLMWQVLRHYLVLASVLQVEDMDDLAFAKLVQVANEQGLLRSKLDAWTVFSALREITLDPYDEEQADEVFSFLSDYLVEAKFLFDQLSKRSK